MVAAGLSLLRNSSVPPHLDMLEGILWLNLWGTESELEPLNYHQWETPRVARNFQGCSPC